MVRSMQTNTLMLASLGIFACGQAIAGPGYKGEPVTQLEGSITTVAGAYVPAETRVTIMWHGVLELFGESKDPTVSEIQIDPGYSLGKFLITLYEPPPAEVLRTLKSEDGEVLGHYATGILIAYVDTNGNGQLDWEDDMDLRDANIEEAQRALDPRRYFTDLVVGGGPNAFVVYSDVEWPQERVLFNWEVQDANGVFRTLPGIHPRAGYSLVHLDPSRGCYTDWVQCFCRAASCPRLENREEPGPGWVCDPQHFYEVPPLMAPPYARAWQPQDVLELRIVKGDEPFMFAKQAFPFM